MENYLEGRYVGSIEGYMCILDEPIHSSEPPVIKLSVHLENGQRIYFNSDNAPIIAQSPPDTTLTASLKLFQENDFCQYYTLSRIFHLFS